MNKNINTEVFLKVIDKINKRFSIIIIVLGILPLPFIYFIPKSYLFVFVIFWMFWMITGFFLSPKIMNQIWKD